MCNPLNEKKKLAFCLEHNIHPTRCACLTGLIITHGPLHTEISCNISSRAGQMMHRHVFPLRVSSVGRTAVSIVCRSAAPRDPRCFCFYTPHSKREKPRLRVMGSMPRESAQCALSCKGFIRLEKGVCMGLCGEYMAFKNCLPT